MHVPVSFSLLQMQVSQCLSCPQLFAAPVNCRYLYPTHLQLTTPLSRPPISYLATHPPTYQSHVSAVITCVCRSPHPVSKSRIRVQSGWETRSPPLLSLSPPLAISLSLSLIAGLCCSCNGNVTLTFRVLIKITKTQFNCMWQYRSNYGVAWSITRMVSNQLLCFACVYPQVR